MHKYSLEKIQLCKLISRMGKQWQMLMYTTYTIKKNKKKKTEGREEQIDMTDEILLLM